MYGNKHEFCNSVSAILTKMKNIQPVYIYKNPSINFHKQYKGQL
jgi:hypothetical protein